jgi:hypothetical protein
MAAKIVSAVAMLAILGTAFAAVAVPEDAAVRSSDDHHDDSYRAPKCHFKYEKCCYEYGREHCYGHKQVDWKDEWSKYFSVRTSDNKHDGNYHEPRCYFKYEKCCYEYTPRYCYHHHGKYQCGWKQDYRCYGEKKMDWNEEWGKYFH